MDQLILVGKLRWLEYKNMKTYDKR